MSFPKRNPANEAARRTIREAFDDLEKAVAPADVCSFENATLQSVRKAALDIENQLGMRTSLRNMRRLSPLFDGLDYLAKSIEILCNGTPFLPWLWAPISLVLTISSGYIRAFDVVIRAYARIGEVLPRFQVLAEAYDQNAKFQQSLAVFYADILRFHKHAYKFVRRNFWEDLFLTSWGRFQRHFDNIIEDLRKHEEQIDKEAQAYDIAEARKARQELEDWRQKSLARLAKEDEEQALGQLQTISTWLRLDETDQLTIFNQVSAEGLKHPGTCGWVLKNLSISSWLRPQPETPFVWLQGRPGSGKSVIAARLINFLRVSHNPPLVVTHFCIYSYASSLQYENILRSLLFQMIQASDDFVAHLYWDYVVRKKSASAVLLEQLLVTICRTLLGEPEQSRAVYVVLDGLDEVDLETQRKLISLMAKMAKETPSQGVMCKVLVSCRSSRLLDQLLQKKSIVSLSNEIQPLEEAIRIYASQRLKEQEHKLAQLRIDRVGIEDLAGQIARRADGMFLWARLVLDYLGTNLFHNRDEIMAAANTLPRKLSEFYERMLVNMMSNFDPRSCERITRILGWVAFAKRPLRRVELRSAISFHANGLVDDEAVPLYIFDACAPIVEHRDSCMSFIHVSVKDYLQTPESRVRIAEGPVIREHCTTSIKCLLAGLHVFSPDYPDSRRYSRVLRGLHSFHIYANEFWVDYVLSLVTTTESIREPESLASAVDSLSQALEGLQSPASLTRGSETSKIGNGLEQLKPYNGLFSSARDVLEARLQKKLMDKVDKHESLRQVKGLPDVLANYQATVKSLFRFHDFPDITSAELDLFKREHRTSAYTCRLPSCPRATTGFETEKLRLKHEDTHVTRHFPCPHTGCQYPPFSSQQALKKHEADCHPTGLPKKSLRRVGSLKLKDGPGAKKDIPVPTPSMLAPPTRAVSQGEKQPVHINTALVSIGSSVAAIGTTHARSGSISTTPPVTSPKSPFSLKVGTALRRKRSKSDIPNAKSLTDNSHPTLPPVATLVETTSMVDQDDGDDEDEEFEDADMKVKSMKMLRDITPNFAGFHRHILRLNPLLASDNKYLVDRIASQQCIRYRSLLNSRVKHINYVQNRNCPCGAMCIALGGSANILDGRGDAREIDPMSACFDNSNSDTTLLKDISLESFPQHIPMPPTQTLPAEFECQICYQIKKLQKTSDWTKHVYEDVQPFTCTWDRCRDPKMFKRKADWVQHENEGHRHLEWWTCDVEDCRHTYYRRDNFLFHLVREHKFPKPKVKTKAAIKKAGGADPTWQKVERCHAETQARPQDEPCRFCGMSFPTWKKLTVHLVKHMEQISLPVLRLVAQKELEADTIISPVQDPPPRSFAPLPPVKREPGHMNISPNVAQPPMGMPYGAPPQAPQSAFVYPLQPQPHFQGSFYSQPAAFDQIGAPMQSIDARAMDMSGFGTQPQYYQTMPTTSDTYMTVPDPYDSPESSVSLAQARMHINPWQLQDLNTLSALGYDTTMDPVNAGPGHYMPHGSTSSYGNSPHQP